MELRASLIKVSLVPHSRPLHMIQQWSETFSR